MSERSLSSFPAWHQAAAATVAAGALGLAASGASWLTGRAGTEASAVSRARAGGEASTSASRLTSAQKQRRAAARADSPQPDTPLPGLSRSASSANLSSSPALSPKRPRRRTPGGAAPAAAPDVIDLTADSDDSDGDGDAGSKVEPFPLGATDADLVRRAFRGPSDGVIAAGHFTGELVPTQRQGAAS